MPERCKPTACGSPQAIPNESAVLTPESARAIGTEDRPPIGLAAIACSHPFNADVLLLLTDVDAVYISWGTTAAQPLGEATPSQLWSQAFAAGSMGPKVEAASCLVEATGKVAGIGCRMGWRYSLGTPGRGYSYEGYSVLPTLLHPQSYNF